MNRGGPWVAKKKKSVGFRPLRKWVITPIISGLTLLIPFITGMRICPLKNAGAPK